MVNNHKPAPPRPNLFASTLPPSFMLDYFYRTNFLTDGIGEAGARQIPERRGRHGPNKALWISGAI